MEDAHKAILIFRTLTFLPDKESLVNKKPQRLKNITQESEIFI